MLCKHCEAEIPSSWGKLVYKNICPACDGVLLSEQELSDLLKVKHTLEQLKPFTLDNVGVLIYERYSSRSPESQVQESKKDNLPEKHSSISQEPQIVEDNLEELIEENAQAASSENETKEESVAVDDSIKKEEGKPLLSQDRANIFVKRSGVKPVKKSDISKKPSSFSDIIKEIQESDSDIFADSTEQFASDEEASATLPTGEDLSSIFETPSLPPSIDMYRQLQKEDSMSIGSFGKIKRTT